MSYRVLLTTICNINSQLGQFLRKSAEESLEERHSRPNANRAFRLPWSIESRTPRRASAGALTDGSARPRAPHTRFVNQRHWYGSSFKLARRSSKFLPLIRSRQGSVMIRFKSASETVCGSALTLCSAKMLWSRFML